MLRFSIIEETDHLVYFFHRITKLVRMEHGSVSPKQFLHFPYICWLTDRSDSIERKPEIIFGHVNTLNTTNQVVDRHWEYTDTNLMGLREVGTHRKSTLPYLQTWRKKSTAL